MHISQDLYVADLVCTTITLIYVWNSIGYPYHYHSPRDLCTMYFPLHYLDKSILACIREDGTNLRVKQKISRCTRFLEMMEAIAFDWGRAIWGTQAGRRNKMMTSSGVVL